MILEGKNVSEFNCSRFIIMLIGHGHYLLNMYVAKS